ncbi:MAG: PrsW family intramembrane metalloprotease, partial [Patescibacteria group bacterium]|nr:PrsW family intramembrane metalloprotease [Patescibacteria group bacterium]
KFLISEDTHKEPFFSILTAFFLGIIAAILSYFSEFKLSLFYPIDSLNYFLFSAFIEEFFKFFLIFIFIMPTKNFHFLIDSMIYLGIAGLGFAFIENLSLKCNVFLNNSTDNPYGLILILSFLRFLGANFLHLLSSVLIGFGLSITLKTRRLFPLLFSFLMASLLHFIYNVFIIKEYLAIYIIPILWSVFLITLKEFKILKELDGRIRTFSSH